MLSSSQKIWIGSGIQDAGSGENLSWIPDQDPGVKTAPDPGSATPVRSDPTKNYSTVLTITAYAVPVSSQVIFSCSRDNFVSLIPVAGLRPSQTKIIFCGLLNYELNQHLLPSPDSGALNNVHNVHRCSYKNF
jgi:hypothetical protein